MRVVPEVHSTLHHAQQLSSRCLLPVLFEISSVELSQKIIKGKGQNTLAISVRPVSNAGILQPWKDFTNLLVGCNLLVVKVIKATINKIAHNSRGDGTGVQDRDLGGCFLLNPGNITGTGGGVV